MKKVLCVCYGNSDRSPAMAAVLAMYLKNAGFDTEVESAGTSDEYAKSGSAAPTAVNAAARIGLDLSGHRKRPISALNLQDYDLFVAADVYVAAELVGKGIPPQMIYNVNITNPWPVQFEQDYEPTFLSILSGMYKVVARYFATKPAA
ncbi:MAG: hypothetical protein WCO03_00255 [bacterium]